MRELLARGDVLLITNVTGKGDGRRHDTGVWKVLDVDDFGDGAVVTLEAIGEEDGRG